MMQESFFIKDKQKMIQEVWDLALQRLTNLLLAGFEEPNDCVKCMFRLNIATSELQNCSNCPLQINGMFVDFPCKKMDLEPETHLLAKCCAAASSQVIL